MSGANEPTQAPSQDQQLREIARIERLRTMRNWALGLGLVSFIFSLTAAGVVGVGNPKSWSSAFTAFAGEGLLRWSVITLIAASFAFFVVGGLLHGLSRRRHGEL